MAFEAQAAEAVPKATEVARATPPVRKYSYSRKRQNAFDAWQEHVRKSAEIASRTPDDCTLPSSR